MSTALPACALRTARRAGSHCQWAQPTFDNWELSSKLQVLCSDEGYSCPAACTRPVPARPEGAPPTRVRRGVHTLSAAEWARVTDALWVMRHLPDARHRRHRRERVRLQRHRPAEQRARLSVPSGPGGSRLGRLEQRRHPHGPDAAVGGSAARRPADAGRRDGRPRALRRPPPQELIGRAKAPRTSGKPPSGGFLRSGRRRNRRAGTGGGGGREARLRRGSGAGAACSSSPTDGRRISLAKALRTG